MTRDGLTWVIERVPMSGVDWLADDRGRLGDLTRLDQPRIARYSCEMLQIPPAVFPRPVLQRRPGVLDFILGGKHRLYAAQAARFFF